MKIRIPTPEVALIFQKSNDSSWKLQMRLALMAGLFVWVG